MSSAVPWFGLENLQICGSILREYIVIEEGLIGYEKELKKSSYSEIFLKQMLACAYTWNYLKSIQQPES